MLKRALQCLFIYRKSYRHRDAEQCYCAAQMYSYYAGLSVDAYKSLIQGVYNQVQQIGPSSQTVH